MGLGDWGEIQTSRISLRSSSATDLKRGSPHVDLSYHVNVARVHDIPVRLPSSMSSALRGNACSSATYQRRPASANPAGRCLSPRQALIPKHCCLISYGALLLQHSRAPSSCRPASASPPEGPSASTGGGGQQEDPPVADYDEVRAGSIIMHGTPYMQRAPCGVLIRQISA